MARKQDKNLIPNSARTPNERRENAIKAGKASGEARRQKKTVADILKIWADAEVSQKNKEALEKNGLGLGTTNRTLLVLPLLDKAKKGDIKAVQMIIELLGEDKKKDLEIKKLKEEIRLLRAETQKISAQFGEDREIEDLSGLAEMLKKENNQDE